MDLKLKTELDLLYDIHQNIIKSTFIKERLEDTKKAYQKEYEILERNLIKKSDEYKMVNNEEVENYIFKLSEKSNLLFQYLLDS